MSADNPPPAKTVHYFMPHRSPRDIGSAMGSRTQHWFAGLFGMRNWIVPNRDDDANVDTLLMHLYNDDSDGGGCTVLHRKGDIFRATSLNYLPVARRSAKGVLVIAPLDTGQTEIVRGHVFDHLMPHSQPWEIRQIRCYRPSRQGDPHGFVPRIWRLTSKRKLESNETEPAVVVAVCGRTSEGPVVVLKERSPSNSIDDFGKLSLISEHVIVEDLVDWVGRLAEPLDADDTQAREQVWKAAGRPAQLMLDERFFKAAAQRELFISCGLDVDFDRLKFHGYRLVNREDGTHLGFAVYRLDLIQDDAVDELDTVTKWSHDMRPIVVDKLYLEPNIGRLNRLLRLQQTWLLGNVLAPAVPDGDEDRTQAKAS
jgi:hypothetical protein